jgi:hypothetical protein
VNDAIELAKSGDALVNFGIMQILPQLVELQSKIKTLHYSMKTISTE